jgi:hypothetical protein
MRGRFAKDDIVLVRPAVRMPFKIPNRKGIVRFAYDHDPPAYDIEFFWMGHPLGVHYFADDELEPFLIQDSP